MSTSPRDIDAERTEQLRDAVLRLSGDPDLRARMGARGKVVARQYTTEIMAQKYLELYESALRGRP